MYDNPDMHSDMLSQGYKWLMEQRYLPLNGDKNLLGPGSQYEIYGPFFLSGPQEFGLWTNLTLYNIELVPISRVMEKISAFSDAECYFFVGIKASLKDHSKLT